MVNGDRQFWKTNNYRRRRKWWGQKMKSYVEFYIRNVLSRSSWSKKIRKWKKLGRSTNGSLETKVGLCTYVSVYAKNESWRGGWIGTARDGGSVINSHKVHAQYTHLAVKIKSGQIYDTTVKREMHKSCSKIISILLRHVWDNDYMASHNYSIDTIYPIKWNEFVSLYHRVPCFSILLIKWPLKHRAAFLGLVSYTFYMAQHK
jgi:hypothetical protein